MNTVVTAVTSIYKFSTERKTFHSTDPRKCFILSYQLSGWYDHDFSFGTLAVHTDTLFLIHPDDPYVVHCREHGESLCVTYYAQSELPTLTIDCSQSPWVLNLFRKLMSLRLLRLEQSVCSAMSVLYELLAFIYARQQPEYLSSDIRSKIREAHHFLLEHYTDPGLQTTQLAAQCGISSKYFRTLFKKLYSATPTQFVIDLRLNAAAELLSQGIPGITEVAAMTGFSDVYYFSRLFKARFGIAPSAFRKQLTSSSHSSADQTIK
ncbi:MAG: helix-turn-helix transcriptional regulator [Ruminococcaceae bacterium]|nr:helix-turn-helix transcriptional regulator [Oscillospiraceae bacterium]